MHFHLSKRLEDLERVDNAPVTDESFNFRVVLHI